MGPLWSQADIGVSGTCCGPSPQAAPTPTVPSTLLPQLQRSRHRPTGANPRSRTAPCTWCCWHVALFLELYNGCPPLGQLQAPLGMPWVRNEWAPGTGEEEKRRKVHEERGWKESPRTTQPLGDRSRQRAEEWKRSLSVQVRVCVLQERAHPHKEEGEACGLPGHPKERRVPSGPGHR